jgi:hypothetical protein
VPLGKPKGEGLVSKFGGPNLGRFVPIWLWLGIDPVTQTRDAFLPRNVVGIHGHGPTSLRKRKRTSRPRALLASESDMACRRPSRSSSPMMVMHSTQFGTTSTSAGNRDAHPAAHAQRPMASNAVEDCYHENYNGAHRWIGMDRGQL